MFNYAMIILFFLYQSVIAMREDLYSAISVQQKEYKKQSKQIVLQENSINLSLLRFKDLNTFLNNRSPEECNKLSKNMSSNMWLMCNLAQQSYDVQKYIGSIVFDDEEKIETYYSLSIQDAIIYRMFDGYLPALIKFKSQSFSKSFALYKELKNRLQKSHKPVGPLFAASDNDRALALKIMYPCCCCPMITQSEDDYIPMLNEDCKQYIINKSVFVVPNKKDWKHIVMNFCKHNAQNACVGYCCGLGCWTIWDPFAAMAMDYYMAGFCCGICIAGKCCMASIDSIKKIT